MPKERVSEDIERFEKFAEEFRSKYGYLPHGKDDPNRPDAQRIIFDLTDTFGELTQLTKALSESREQVRKEKERGDAYQKLKREKANRCYELTQTIQSLEAQVRELTRRLEYKERALHTFRIGENYGSVDSQSFLLMCEENEEQRTKIQSLEAQIKAKDEKIAELESKLDYPHEEIADLQVECQSLRTILKRVWEDYGDYGGDIKAETLEMIEKELEL